MGRYIYSDSIDFEIGYDEFPDRKKPMLVIHEKGKNSGIALASFSNKKNAEFFMKKLYEMTLRLQGRWNPITKMEVENMFDSKKN